MNFWQWLTCLWKSPELPRLIEEHRDSDGNYIIKLQRSDGSVITRKIMVFSQEQARKIEEICKNRQEAQ